MQIECRGGDDPEIAVVGGIHGDEPCGVEAIERLLSEDRTFERPVAFVIANEKALTRAERYVESDLNRSFPGDIDGESHESRLAARLSEEIGDCTTLSMHSTQSSREMFALVKDLGLAGELCPYLSIAAVVDVGDHDKGRLFESVDRLIEIECGFQGSAEAEENAYTVTREFLGATGALPDERRRPQRELPVYRLAKPVPKDGASTYEVYAENFEAVEPGEAFAAVDNEAVIADEGFYPVLMSPYGYENLFGYAAERTGTVEPPAGAITGESSDS